MLLLEMNKPTNHGKSPVDGVETGDKKGGNVQCQTFPVTCRMSR